MQPSTKSFYDSLRLDIKDHRSNTGKKHNLAFVLFGFILGIITGRKKRASIQRFMKNNHSFLCKATGFDSERAISNPQLGRLLNGLDIKRLNEMVYEHYGVEISELETGDWVSIDGKDLKGSIDSQISTRSEVLVHGVKHSDRNIVANSFYEGDKDSEKIAVRNLLKETELESKSVTLDALHTDPTTLEQIASQGGQYIVQVKENQKELTKDLASKERRLPCLNTVNELDKGHGRLEKRTYQFFNIEDSIFDKRWKPCQLCTLIVVNRHFEYLKTGKIMEEKSFYISNVSIEQHTIPKTQNLAGGIRGHWSIENVNQIRDVAFKEDSIKTKRGNYSKAFAIAISLAFACLNKIKTTNFVATMEDFADNKLLLLDFLKNIKFL
jgi:predicted transposase YbfD/YdcC